MDPMLAIARALERGLAADSCCGRQLSLAWRLTVGRSVTRRLDWPDHVRVIAVGGSTLGGSGKTPLAIGCTALLAAAGARAILVGHGYRARARDVRLVSPRDAVGAVGDEALMAARELEPFGDRARVVIGPSRSAAVAWAARRADVLVLDGVSQTEPERASLALLALDALEPWGHAAAIPPCGDLRAPISTLVDACDAIVPIGHLRAPPAFAVPGSAHGAPVVWPSRVVESRGAWLDARAIGLPVQARLLAWETLRQLRVGLVTAMARSERVVRDLARNGVRPCAVVCARDHGPLGWRAVRACAKAASARRVDVWLSTPKCAVHARAAPLGAPLAVLEYKLALHPALGARLRAIAEP
jgi:tetraacyldisaccharide-1-P 4'-kinase